LISGILDEMANKIVALLRYEPLWNTLADHGEQEIELFTWDRVAENTLDVYREVVYLFYSRG